jgi:uncharacterized protein
VVVEVADAGLVEQAWLNRVLTIGDEIGVKVSVPTERCVMITNPQYDLGSDVSIMRTLAQANDERFGVYADVITSRTNPLRRCRRPRRGRGRMTSLDL